MPGPKLVKRARQEAAQRKRSKLTPEVEAHVRKLLSDDPPTTTHKPQHTIGHREIDKVVEYVKDLGLEVRNVGISAGTAGTLECTLTIQFPPPKV